MRLIRLASSTWHSFWLLIGGIVVLIWWVSVTWWFSRHDDDIWLVTFAKDKLHPPSFISWSDIHRVMTRFIFVCEVGRLGGIMWLWGADQLVLWIFNNEKANSTTCYLTRDHFRDMTHPILALNLVFIGNWLIYNLILMSSTYTTLNDKRSPPMTSNGKQRIFKYGA